MMAIEAVQRSQGGEGGEGVISLAGGVQATVKQNIDCLVIFFYFISQPTQHPPPVLWQLPM